MDVQDSQLMDAFRSHSEGSFQALLWYRMNKHIFKFASFEPMCFQINYKQEQYKKYLESTVNVQAMISFFFVDADDMTKFLRIIFYQLKLPGVCATMYTLTEKIEFKSNLPINNISHLGFYTYLHETFTAPPIFYNYICNTFDAHNLPIGNSLSHVKHLEALEIFPIFFTDTHKVTMSLDIPDTPEFTPVSEVLT